ncbi:MAG: glycerate dehydrogenase, partial [Sinobacterium sp.]|nr:glycerate dehydrogenase [Sinobacterium sp.]
TPESNNLITEQAFKQMKPSAILLNLGRGGIVNEQDLADALIAKQISGAATDVLTQEPPSPDHILLNDSIPNLLIMPHTAWSSRQARQQLLGQIVDILQSFSTNTIKNCVNQ